MFRAQYIDNAQLASQLRAWQQAHPEFVQVSSLGRSAQGQDIPLLVLGRDPARLRPAVWVDGNMHATEFCGTNVALAIAEDLIGILQGGTSAGGQALPEPMCEVLRDTLFYIAPRLSPDGAEAMLKAGNYVRSSPVNDRSARSHAWWQAADVDGDGQALQMRREDPDGDLVALRGEDGLPLEPQVLVPRAPGDAGPFYRLYPEGHIVNFDGQRIPDPWFLSDNVYDLNRNFAYDWRPEHQQAGAGHFPGSAPESRAVMEFATRHPNILVWLNLHTFGGVGIRPLGHQPDSKMNQTDLAIYRQVGQWLEAFTGHPLVSNFHEFLYEPEKPLHGSLSEWAYHHRGCLAYVIELWDLFAQLGMERVKPFVEHYERVGRKEMLALWKLDREINEGRIFRPWRKVVHPQLGEVEVGGFDARIGISNPPLSRLGPVCQAQSAAFLRVAALVPRWRLEQLDAAPLGAGQTRIRLRVRNTGYLGTEGIPSSAALGIAEPMRMHLQGEGVRLEAPATPVLELGHLAGWGRGLHNGPAFFIPWSRGNGHERVVTLVVSGRGTLQVRAGSSRCGWQSLAVVLD